jgi:heme/copper-type cytochrome/quinol oxidase subunit 2
MTFVHSYYFFVVFSFIAGLIFFQVFYIWFGLAIMWNYRANGIPVTGLVASSAILGAFIPIIILNIFRFTGVGVFEHYKSLEDLAKIENISEILSTLKKNCYFNYFNNFCFSFRIYNFFNFYN